MGNKKNNTLIDKDFFIITIFFIMGEREYGYRKLNIQNRYVIPIWLIGAQTSATQK